MSVASALGPGARVLVPVTARRRTLAERLRGEGLTVDEVEFIAIAPPAEPERLHAATRAWCAGEYTWLATTSRNAVDAVAASATEQGLEVTAPLPQSRVAAVGDSTRGVLDDLGLHVSLWPSGRANAAGLVADFPDGDGRVFLPRGNLAGPVLERGIARLGWSVDAVEAYRTRDGAGPSDALVAAVAAGDLAAIVLTSGSVAERLAARVGAVPSGTMVVAIGGTTRASAIAAGLRVDAVAVQPTYDGIIAAIETAAGRSKDD